MCLSLGLPKGPGEEAGTGSELGSESGKEGQEAAGKGVPSSQLALWANSQTLGAMGWTGGLGCRCPSCLHGPSVASVDLNSLASPVCYGSAGSAGRQNRRAKRSGAGDGGVS